MRPGYEHEIFQAGIAATILFFVLVSFIISYIIIFRRKRSEHRTEIQLSKAAFDQQLLQSQMEVQHQTMQSIGDNLHDNIGQVLSLTRVTLESIDTDNKEKAAEKIGFASELVIRSIKEIRELAHRLNGEHILQDGLINAIAAELHWLQKSDAYAIEYQPPINLPPINNQEKDLILFRLVQEALNNIIKHALASQITVTIQYTNTTGIHISIADNGQGFDVPLALQQQKGMGLSSVLKRVHLIGGDFTINSSLGGGTEVKINVLYP